MKGPTHTCSQYNIVLYNEFHNHCSINISLLLTTAHLSKINSCAILKYNKNSTNKVQANKSLKTGLEMGYTYMDLNSLCIIQINLMTS